MRVNNLLASRVQKTFPLFCRAVLLPVALTIFATSGTAQKKKPARQSKTAQPESAVELSKLRDQYIKTTREYKASLQKLMTLYQDSSRKAEQRLYQSNKLFADGLISKRELQQSERAVANANLKVSGVQQQIATADTQIAQTLLEIEGEKQLAKLGPMQKGSLVKTTSFIRYNGT